MLNAAYHTLSNLSKVPTHNKKPCNIVAQKSVMFLFFKNGQVSSALAVTYVFPQYCNLPLENGNLGTGVRGIVRYSVSTCSSFSDPDWFYFETFRQWTAKTT